VSEEKQLRECSSCQTVNDNSAQFCLECGQKLAPVGRGAAPDEQAPAAPSSGRPRLHSPILGGYEDIDDSPRKPKEPKITAPRAKGAHLRSPLLGGNDGEDDDEEVFDDTAMKPGKGKPQGAKPGGKMRSPLLGKSGPSSDDDYEEDFPLRDRNNDRSAFPHRSRPREADPEMPAPQQHAPQQSSGKAHLRSPLLGGSDEDDYEEEQFSPPTGRKQPQQQPGNSRPQKLKSPMFDRASSSGGYNDYDDEEVEEVDDPNVLRSPLLAAKSRLPQARTNQNQPRPYPSNDAPQMQQNAQGMQPGQGQQGYNQQPQQPAYNQQAPSQQAYAAAPQQQQPMQQGQPPQHQQQPQQVQQPQQPMGQTSPQAGQAAFGAPPQNPQQPVFAPAPPINPNASANGLQAVPFPGQQSQPNQQSQPGHPGQTNPTPLNQTYEYGAPGASLTGGPSSPIPSASANANSQRSTMMEFPVQAQQAPQASAATPPAPQAASPTLQSTKAPIFPTVVSGTASGASSHALDDDEFSEHPAVNDLAPLPKPKPAKLGGGRFAQSASPLDDDDDDLTSNTGRGLPLSAQQPISRKRPGAISSASDDHDHYAGSNAGGPATPIMVIFITGFLCTIAKAYFLFSFWKQFAASMPMLVDQLGQLALFVGLLIFAMQGSKK
jgi:hypothetical protein